MLSKPSLVGKVLFHRYTLAGSSTTPAPPVDETPNDGKKRRSITRHPLRASKSITFEHGTSKEMNTRPSSTSSDDMVNFRATVNEPTSMSSDQVNVCNDFCYSYKFGHSATTKRGLSDVAAPPPHRALLGSPPPPSLQRRPHRCCCPSTTPPAPRMSTTATPPPRLPRPTPPLHRATTDFLRLNNFSFLYLHRRFKMPRMTPESEMAPSTFKEPSWCHQDIST
uniref:Uncharacterized protein n=1 Tax=Oryza brachyantha TaxID=4533 RepID=J3L090_ORYBR